jgi:chromosome segregation ATPase
LDAAPEEGKPGEIAAVSDALSEAEGRLHKVEEEASKASVREAEAKEKLDEITAGTPPGAGRELMEKVEAAQRALDEASGEVERANRRVAKAKAKAEEAERQAVEAGVAPSKAGQGSSETGEEGPGESEEKV